MAKVREEHILNKRIINSSKEYLKSFNRLCRQAFSCQADAQKAFDRWQKEQEFSQVLDMKIIEKKQRQKRERPAIDAEYQAHFCITGALSTSLNLSVEAQDTKGLFIIAINDCSKNLSMQFILNEYKSQQAVERGFRF